MISVKRIEEGKILHENFDSPQDLIADGWQMHPAADRFFMSHAEGYLHVLHGDTPTYLLRELPDDAVLEMANTYNPTAEYDVGGFVAYVSDEHSLQLYEYYSVDMGTTLSFPFIRLVKAGTEYEGYGSQDGENWDIRGAMDFPEANKWGICLEGAEGETLLVHTLSVYKSTELKFQALPKGGRVELWDMAKATPVLLDTTFEKDYEAVSSTFSRPVPLHINFKVYDAEGVLVADDTYDDVFGGDVFNCGNYLEVYYDGKPLDLQGNDFGYIDTFYKDFKLELKNMISVPHTNVHVEIKKFNAEFGDEWVEICKDVNGVPDGNFQKQLFFDEIAADGQVDFWVRITRSSVPISVDDYLFDFVVNVW